MTLAMNESRRRLLAVGLAIVLLLVVIAAIAVPTWWLHQRYDRVLADFGDQLVRHQRIVATREATEANLNALRARQTGRMFLRSASPTVAASELQDLARTAIESNGARLISVQIPPSREEGRYRVVTINVQLSASGPALRRILHSLESSQPLVLVDSVTVRQSVGTGFRPAPGTEPEMFVQMELVGHAIGVGQ